MGLNDRQSKSFCSPDHVHREGFVAVTRAADGTDKVVGHLCLEPTDEHRSLELALAVDDAEQGRGIGRALFLTAVDWARPRGYSSIVANCMADNSRVLRLLTSAPFGAAVSAADCGLVDVVIPLFAPPPADLSVVPPRGTARRRGTHGQPGEIHAIWMGR